MLRYTVRSALWGLYIYTQSTSSTDSISSAPTACDFACGLLAEGESAWGLRPRLLGDAWGEPLAAEGSAAEGSAAEASATEGSPWLICASAVKAAMSSGAILDLGSQLSSSSRSGND